MTRRENILKAIRFERPDHVPMSFYVNASCWHHYDQDALQDLMESHPFLFPMFSFSDPPCPLPFLRLRSMHCSQQGCHPIQPGTFYLDQAPGGFHGRRPGLSGWYRRAGGSYLEDDGGVLIPLDPSAYETARGEIRTGYYFWPPEVAA